MFKKLNFFYVLFFTFAYKSQVNPYHPAVTGMQALAGYNNFWDTALGGRGYWGRTPSTTANVFNSKWDDSGYNSIYNLNSLSPFAQNLFPGFDSMTPYYTPNGTSKYSFYPTQSNYLNNDQLGSFAYDINEPRYTELYKQYYKFYNTDLDRLAMLHKYTSLTHDLNKDQYRIISNPQSFEYNRYFDGFDEDHSMRGPHVENIAYRKTGNPPRAFNGPQSNRILRQIDDGKEDQQQKDIKIWDKKRIEKEKQKITALKKQMRKLKQTLQNYSSEKVSII